MRYKDIPIQDVLDYVNEHYTYDSQRGIFTHATNKRGTPKKIGDVAGHVSKSNDCHVMYIYSIVVARYRLIWLLEHGTWPDGYIRHLDGNKYNDRISNLMLSHELIEACKAKNSIKRPRGKLPDNITFMERRGQYRVDIPGRPAQYFDSLSQAERAL